MFLGIYSYPVMQVQFFSRSSTHCNGKAHPNDKVKTKSQTTLVWLSVIDKDVMKLVWEKKGTDEKNNPSAELTCTFELLKKEVGRSFLLSIVNV